MLRQVLENYDESQAFWGVFDRSAVCRVVEKPSASFSSSGEDTHAMGYALAGICWVLGFGIIPTITSRDSYAALAAQKALR